MGEKDHSDKQLAGDGGLSYVPLPSIDAVRRATNDPVARAELLADVCRLNTLYMIMQAGSGHIGSSFSSPDFITLLWAEGLLGPDRRTTQAGTSFSSTRPAAPARDSR